MPQHAINWYKAQLFEIAERNLVLEGVLRHPNKKAEVPEVKYAKGADVLGGKNSFVLAS